jgi:hypothetical protein
MIPTTYSKTGFNRQKTPNIRYSDILKLQILVLSFDNNPRKDMNSKQIISNISSEHEKCYTKTVAA